MDDEFKEILGEEEIVIEKEIEEVVEEKQNKHKEKKVINDFSEVQNVYIRNKKFRDREKRKENQKIIKLSRRRLREEAFKILFSMEFIKNEEEYVEIYSMLHNIKYQEDIEYLKNIVKIYNEEKEEIEKIIQENKKETWEYSRIDKVALALIKLSIIEIGYIKIPFKISINECINICRKYSEEKNTKFINGILANYVKIKGIENEG